jgi:hypothetical protein
VDFRRALQQLGSELEKRKAPSKVWVVGSGALVLGHGLKRIPGDIDCILKKGKHSLIQELVAAIGTEDPEWLNFEFEKFNDSNDISSLDFSKTESFGALSVCYASLELVLAQKCSDARGSGFRDKDFQDIEFCVKNLGLTTLDEVYEIVESKDLLDTTTDEEAFQLEKFLRAILPKVATGTFGLI